MSNSLKILSGGAAQSLVTSIAPRFAAMTDLAIDGEFGAVGIMADMLRNGTSADIVILAEAVVAKLVEEGLVTFSSVSNVGIVETALAVRSGDPQVTVYDAASLRAAFLASDAIFIPDTKASTAGVHIAKVLDQLAIANDVADRLRIHPNGATAMRHLARSDAARPFGCTQSTEIISTEGVALTGSLPRGCDLATMYTAGVTTLTNHALQARLLIDLMIGADQRELRSRVGFVSR